MEGSPNGSESNIHMASYLAIEIFRKVCKYLRDKQNSNVEWEILEAARVAVTEQSGTEVDNDSVQGHFISSVVFRCISQSNGENWALESFSDHVNISQLDEIGLSDYESYHLNYKGHRDIKTAMAQNIDTVLLRNILDWSRPDGNVWSAQVIWSGSFSDSRWILVLMEEDSPSMEVRLEQFDLHRHLRDRYLGLHGTYPMAAAFSAVESSLSIIISEELVRQHQGEDGEAEGFPCVICHDMFSIGESANQLRCGHMYHWQCIFQWFYRRLQCPLCRDKLH